MDTLQLSAIDKTRPVHFIGIGGVSMSALALVMVHHGYTVTGSDFKDGRHLDRLKSAGIPVAIGHSAANIGDAALVVYTAAIGEDNPELMRARSLGLPVVERPVLLGAMMERFQYPVAVSGTHGKTTTTSMLAHILMRGGFDPTVMVGGNLPAIGGNLREGRKEYMVTEACEYHGSFLHFRPKLAIILNVEEDHLDYFQNLDDIVDCFAKFAQVVPKEGCIVVNADNANAMRAVRDAKCAVITYGIETQDAEYTARNISFNTNGQGRFDLYHNGKYAEHIALSVTGIHNVSNAVAAIAASAMLGVAPDAMREGLLDFTGTDRRFQLKGEVDGVRVIDDYAHHPTEIAATLEAAKKMNSGRIWCVFQPHTYTRAYMLKDAFAKCFGGCERVIVTDIYAAREKDTGLIHASELADAINAQSGNAVYIKGFPQAAAYLKEHMQPGDLVLTLGAGDVYRVGDLLLA